MKQTNKGFTLIELLVVVAIIGILAAVVLTSLGSARTKAKDAAIMAQASSMRAEAELAVTSSGYPVTANFCLGAGDTLNGLITGIVSQGGTVYSCHSTASAWGFAVTLNNGTYYCVDSTGFAGAGNAAPATEITSSNLVCSD